MPPPPAKPRGRRPPQAFKKPKKKGLPSPCPTPFLDLTTNDKYVYCENAHTSTATCLRFEMSDTDQGIPEPALEYLLSVLRPVASQVHRAVMATNSLLFMVDVMDRPLLDRLLKAELTVPGTSCKMSPSHASIAQTVQDCLKDLDMELGMENEFSEDFSMPSTSSDEEDQPRKVATPRQAKHVLPAIQPTPPVRALQAAIPLPPPVRPVQSAIPLPPPAAKPEPAKGPSTSEAQPVLTPAVPAEEAPSTSLGSALDSQPAASPPTSVVTAAKPAEASATATTSRRRRFRFREVNFNELAVEIPAKEPCVTILIRPVDPAVDYAKQNGQKVAKELSAFGNYTAIRDIRAGGLAVDFDQTTTLAPLLAMTSLLGHAVTCSKPSDNTSIQAVVSGIHPDVSEADILAEMMTSPPTRLLAVKRLARPGQESWSVRLTIEGTTLPSRALLHGRSRRITPFLTKPLQCLQCGRYGHTARICRSSLRCWTCGKDHPTQDCPSRAEPFCCNCGGPHPADAITCPSRKLETKVCAVKQQTGATFRVARTAVTQAARTYAAAMKGPAKQQQPPGRKPPLLEPEPQLAGGFLPNTAHPRAPSSKGLSPKDQCLAALFKGLLSILTTAATSADLTTAIADIASLFRSHAPDAEASAFAI